jgi:hypothetical protein
VCVYVLPLSHVYLIWMMLHQAVIVTKRGEHTHEQVTHAVLVHTNENSRTLSQNNKHAHTQTKEKSKAYCYLSIYNYVSIYDLYVYSVHIYLLMPYTK